MTETEVKSVAVAGPTSEEASVKESTFCFPAAPVSDDPFVDIREAAEADDGAARALLVILSALRETIEECRATANGGAGGGGGCRNYVEPSPSEYLAAILSALEGADQSHAPQMLALLEAVMPHAHRTLLRLKFPAIAAVLTRLLKEHGEEAVEGDSVSSGSANVLQRLLQCMGQLLASQETSSAVWSSPGVLRGFHSLLHFFADRRSKVRRSAHESIVLILIAQLGTSACTPAGGGGHKKAGNGNKGPAAHTVEFCQAVVSSCTSQDVTRAMHLLQFMRLAVPLFRPKQASDLCELSLKLLSLGSPPLTAAVMQMLSAVVQSPRPCMTALFLAQLTEKLLKLQPSRSAGAGAVAFAPLLASCMVRLQSMDPEASSALLARTTHALVDYCESSSSAVHTASCGALNLMFQICVDQGMVTEMAGSLGQGGAGAGGMGGPLADTLSALETLLQYRFQRSWAKSLPLLGRLFLHLRGASFPLLVGILRGLGELHDALNSVPSAALPGVTSALNEAIAFAIEGMGAERVLSVLPLAPAGTTPVAEGGVAEARAWLLPLLTEHARAAPSRLAFFHQYVLATAKTCDGAAKSERLTANQARTQRFRVVQLWALLPGFCARPTDVASSFGALAPVLANAMQDASYPGILPEVCAGLQTLVNGVKTREAQGDQVAKIDHEKLSNTATRFLPKLFALLDPGEEGTTGISTREAEAGAGGGDKDPAAAAAAANERTAAVSAAAAAMASIAPASYLSSLFRKLLHKLIQATAAAAGRDENGDGMGTAGALGKATALVRAQVLLELAAGLAPSLDDEGISLLYRAAKPLVRDDASQHLQKRAYKVLLALCTHRPDFMSSADILQDVLDLFTSSLLTCHVSARVMRLQCLSRLTASFTPGDSAQAQFLTTATLEVVLCTKDSNGRTRELAYNVLVLMAVARGNPAEAVRTVVGGLAAVTPHARSAAVMALGHLQLEFGHFRSERWDERVADMVPDLTQTMLLLLREPSREVVKAVLGWLRVAAGGADREVLRPMVGDIVRGVMSGTTPRHRDHFRAKIRSVLSKLCRKFGFEYIKELMPEQDKKLVAHMQTTAERELRAKKTRLAGGGDANGGDGSGGRGRGHGAEENDGRGGVTKALRTFDAIMEDSDAEDGGDSEDDHPASSKPGRNGKNSTSSIRRGAGGADMMVRERGEDGTSVVDLLDASMVRNMKISRGPTGNGRSNRNYEGDSDFDSDMDTDGDDGPELALKDGKFVIPGGDCDSEDSDENDRSNGGGGGGGGSGKKKRSLDADSDEDNIADTRKDTGRRGRAREDAAAAGGGGRGVSAADKRQKTGAVRGTVTGAEYRSKKAGGDVYRKGAKLEPYAYIPLDGRTLTGKKAGGVALKQYEAVVGTSGREKRGYQQRRGGQQKK